MWRTMLAIVAGLITFSIVGGVLGPMRMVLYRLYPGTSQLVGIVHAGISLLCSGFVIGLVSTRKHVIASLVMFTSLIAVWGIIVFEVFPQLGEFASPDEKQWLVLYVFLGLLFLAAGAWLGVMVERKHAGTGDADG